MLWPDARPSGTELPLPNYGKSVAYWMGWVFLQDPFGIGAQSALERCEVDRLVARVDD